MIRPLIQLIREKGISPTAEEIGDVLWLLALSRPQERSDIPRPVTSVGPLERPTSVASASEKNAVPAPPRVMESDPLKPEDAESPPPHPTAPPRIPLHAPVTPNGRPQGPSPTISLPAFSGSALERRLEIGRALRPLRRTRPDYHRSEVDEEATSHLSAEFDLRLTVPVLRPATVRWLDLVLLVDTSRSMGPWWSTAEALRDLFVTTGAFRHLRTYTFDSDLESQVAETTSQSRKLVVRAGLRWTNQGPPVTAATLAGAGSPSLVVVVSDTVGKGWRTGQLTDMLGVLGSGAATLLLNVLPLHLWRFTALGRMPSRQVRALTAGSPSNALQIAERQRPLGRYRDHVRVPVTAIDPVTIARWSRMLVKPRELSTIVLLPPSVAVPGEAVGPSSAAPAPSLSAEDRLHRFGAAASPLAQELARLFSLVSLSLPTMRLLKRALLPEAGNEHLAEFLLGGLIEEVPTASERPHPELVEYAFFPGVREQLARELPLSMWERVGEVLSREVERRSGVAPDFSALIHDPEGVIKRWTEPSMRPFANVAAPFLEALGGRYRDLAKRLVAPPAPQDRPPGPKTSDGDPEPGRVDLPRGEPRKRDLLADANRVVAGLFRVLDSRKKLLASEIVSNAARVARLRHPDDEVVELSAPAPFVGLVVVMKRTEHDVHVEPIGVLGEAMSRTALVVFREKIEKPYREEDPLLLSRIVHTGSPASQDLYRRARRQGVSIETLASYRKLVDFQRYLDWQTGRIEKDPAYPEDLYVPQRAELRIRLAREDTSDVLDRLVELLTDPYPRLVLVLGDFGTGKTFLLRQLARRLARLYKERPDTVPPPVLVEMRALEKSVGLDGLLAQHFQLQGGREISVAAFRYLLSEGRAALLFDGFDELASRVSYDGALSHLQMVLDAAQGKAKVVLTSRAAHFLNDNGVELELARRMAERDGYRLVKLYPFDERQIHAVLVNRLGSEDAAKSRMELLREVADLMGLSQNPRMLELISEIPAADLAAAREEGGRISSATLYELLVTRWLESEETRSTPRGSEPALTLGQMWEVITALAVFAWTHAERRIRKQDIPAELWSKLERMDPNRRIDVGAMELAVGSRSLLVRDEEGGFSFWHRSILEWLVARASAADIREKGAAPALERNVMSDLMADFLAALVWRERAVAWARASLSGGNDTAIQNANRLLRRMGVEPDPEDVSAHAALDLSGQDLRGQDLSGSTHLRGAILTEANLDGATLLNADLEGADLSGASLMGANAEQANLKNVSLKRANLQHARLLAADMQGAELQGASMRYARLIGAGIRIEQGGGVDLFGSAPPRPTSAEACFPGDVSGTLDKRLSRGLAVSPDGALVAVGYRSGTILLWDVATCRPLRSLQGHAKQVTALAFSPDMMNLFSGSEDGSVLVWNVETGAQFASLLGAMAPVTAISVSPDGGQIAVGCADCRIRICDALHHRLITNLSESSAVLAVRYSPDGKALASGAEDGTVILWHAGIGAALMRQSAHAGPVRAVAFSPDGSLLATGSLDSTTILWDVARRRPTNKPTRAGGPVCSLAFSPDGSTLAVGDTDGNIDIREAHTGTQKRRLSPRSGAVVGLEHSPDGRSLFAAGAISSVRVFAAATGLLRATLIASDSHTRCVEFSPDRALLASANSDGRIWIARSSGAAYSLQNDAKDVQALAWSPDSNTLACGLSDHKVWIWDVRSPSFLGALSGHTGPVTSLAFCSDNRTLASGSADTTVRLWSVSDGSHDVLRGTDGPITGVRFSPDGRRLVCTTEAGALVIWHVRRKERLISSAISDTALRCVAFSPDQDFIATGAEDGAVRLHRSETARTVRVLRGHGSDVLCVAFSPDGQNLASGSSDGSIRAWSVETGSSRTLAVQLGTVTSLSFSPDGRHLASTSRDGAVRIWSLHGSCRATMVFAQKDWAAFRPDGRYKTSAEVDGFFWHTVGLCRFEVGELDPYLRAFAENAPARMANDEPLW